MTDKSLQIYDRVSNLTRINLGLVGQDLVDQQIHDRLHKEPEELSRDDLKKMLNWISALASLITDDMDKVRAYVIQLKRLANSRP